MSMRIATLLLAIAAVQAGCASSPPQSDAALQARDARRQAALAECEKQKGNETYINCVRAARQLE